VNQLRLLSPSVAVAPAPLSPPTEIGAARDSLRARAPRVQLLGPGVDLDSLRCFEAVATTLRFRAAAARVHLSPGALSERIRRLEEGLGTRILARTTRSVSLTEAGARLLPLARSVLGLVDSMSGAAHADAVPQRYELLLGTRYEIGLSWLCPILGRLGQKRPERTVHLYNGSSSDLVGRLETGELDAVVASLPFHSPRLTYAPLHEEEYLLVGVGTAVRGREDARRLTLVDIGPDLPLIRYLLDAQPDAEPWSFARVEYMGGIANVRLRLLEGEARVGVLPTFFIRADLAKGSLKNLMPRARLRSDRLRLIWRRGHPRETELMALARDLREFPLR
jgi:LysR family transcriptional regulator, glycine cleavage system transcriptional activator